MISTSILRLEVQSYLEQHRDTPITKFILKGSPFPEITIQALAQQLEGRRKAKTKLPLWHTTSQILFPPKLNLEQTSSEETATYKASLMTGETLVDGTGGFGIDSYYFSRVIPKVYYVEMNAELAALANANFKTLNVSNVETIVSDSINFITSTTKQYDTIYLDPSRRSDVKGKVFMLTDCLPNVPKHMNALLKQCKNLWVKTAPMLDIVAGLKELQNVSELHIVSVKNEVKELLWKLTTDTPETPLRITVIDLRADQHIKQSFDYDEVSTAMATYGKIGSYLYEPMASLLKAGAFQWVSKHYGLDKLQEHSHLYTGDRLLDFAGRRFKVRSVVPFSKSLRKELNLFKANITTRNFPLTVAEIRKKFKIKEGGKDYIFFTTLEDLSKVAIWCEKI